MAQVKPYYKYWYDWAVDRLSIPMSANKSGTPLAQWYEWIDWFPARKPDFYPINYTILYYYLYFTLLLFIIIL